MAEYDYILVGSGSSGGALAARLSERDGCNVLLIEAGGRCDQLPVRMPIAWHPTSENPKFGWDFHSEPEPQMGNRVLHQARGKLLGGSSSINGMMYSRGNPQDYDSWAAMGLTGWSYNDVLPYFKRSESNWRGESAYHGGNGPMSVVSNPKEPKLYDAMISAASAMGYQELDDFHGAQQEGFGMPDFTVRKGQRESSYTGYLASAKERQNLTVVTHAQVTELLMEDKTVTGLKYQRTDSQNSDAQNSGSQDTGFQDNEQDEITVYAKEVILCAGAFGSPHILMLSGIGDQQELEQAGVTCKHHLPAVGKHLKDHPMIALGFVSNTPFSFETMLRFDQLAIAVSRWLINHSGPLGEAPLSVQGYIRTRQNTENGQETAPDTQFQVSHVSFQAKPWFPGLVKGAGHQFTAAAMQLQPKGEGSVSLRSADPFDKPAIKLGLFSHEEDKQAARDMFRFIREYFATEPLSSLVECELFPGMGVMADEEIDGYISQTIQTGMHPTSSCRMGLDDQTSVVDAELKVHGLKGLRICDTSVMPNIVRGNTSAPAMMIAEKAADMILGKAPPRSSQKQYVSREQPSNKNKELLT